MKHKNFRDFWPFYVREHLHPLNRAVHFGGTAAALSCVTLSIVAGPFWLAALAPVCGYGSAWAGHFLIEKNRPATFSHPIYSLLGDFVMFGCILTRSMKREIAKATATAD